MHVCTDYVQQNHKVVEGSANVDLVASNVNGKECVQYSSLCISGTNSRYSFIFTLLTNTLGVAVLSIDGPGQTSLVGVTDLKDVLADAGAPIRTSLIFTISDRGADSLA